MILHFLPFLKALIPFSVMVFTEERGWGIQVIKMGHDVKGEKVAGDVNQGDDGGMLR